MNTDAFDTTPATLHPHPMLDAPSSLLAPAKRLSKSKNPSRAKASRNRGANVVTKSIIPARPDHTMPASHDADSNGWAPASLGRDAVGLEQTDAQLGLADPIAYRQLRILAEVFADFQKTRIALGNRLLEKRPRHVTYAPKPNGSRASVFPEFADIMPSTQRVEDELAKRLVALYRTTAPAGVVRWQQSMRGIGEHTMARVLGHLGHPRIARPMAWVAEPPEGHECDPLRCKKRDDGTKRHLVEQPPFARTISQLWSYCGYGDPRRKRMAGLTQAQALSLGSPTLKMLVHLLVDAVVKAGTIAIAKSSGGPSRPSQCARSKHDANPNERASEHIPAGAIGQKRADSQTKGADRYRRLYDCAKAGYAARVHVEPCPRCGRKGKPAEPGMPWRPGHIDGAAKRRVAKEILRDLWLAAEDDGPARVIPQPIDAAPTIDLSKSSHSSPAPNPTRAESNGQAATNDQATRRGRGRTMT